MSEKKEKIYVGSGKKGHFEDQVNFTLIVDKIPNEWYYDYKGLKCVNLTLSKKLKPDEWGKTHSVTINDFKPEKQTLKEGYVKDEPVKDITNIEPIYDDTDIPF